MLIQECRNQHKRNQYLGRRDLAVQHGEEGCELTGGAFEHLSLSAHHRAGVDRFLIRILGDLHRGKHTFHKTRPQVPASDTLYWPLPLPAKMSTYFAIK